MQRNCIENAEVSVVIPYYNDSPVFERCLLSVINQNVKPKEIIVIDDCSDDSETAKEIIRKSASEIDVLYIRNHKNMNGAYSRNLGMVESKGEYIALLDADDFWKVTHIQENINIIKNKDGVDFIYSDVIEVDESGEEKVRKVTNHKNIKNRYDIIFSSPPQTNSFFFKKEVVQYVKFNDKLRRHQDYQFIIDVIKCDSVNVLYNSLATSCYCVSHRSEESRVNFNSVFEFWNENYHLFTRRKLSSFLIRQVHSCIRITGGSQIKELIGGYEIFNEEFVKNRLYIKLARATDFHSKYQVIALRVLYYCMFSKVKVVKYILKKGGL